jgi:phosphoribosylanthranilate isomerase
MSVWVKICGVTIEEDALDAVDAGADAVGVNLVPSSKRRVEVSVARAIHDAVGSRAQVIAVVADMTLGELGELREATGIRMLQLHGSEPPELVAALLPGAYKAIRVGSAVDVALATRFPGTRMLADSKVSGALGGSGQRFDWTLVRDLAAERELVLAGGLDPDNVAGAIRVVRPFGVDNASGV